MKKLAYALLAVALLVLAVIAGATWYLHRAEADPDVDARVAGLGAPVEVWRDSLGVPHVWARDEADLFRAVGYVHAQDRLWQMELFRRVADGRLAEVLGAQMVKTDEFLRTVGMGHAAAENERRLDPRSRALLQAYADGVNAYIAQHRGAWPPEFEVLRFHPQPWTVRNSLSIAKIMAWDLADWNAGLDQQRAIDLVGETRAKELNPPYPAWGVDILGEDAQWKGKPASASPAPPSDADSVAGYHAMRGGSSRIIPRMNTVSRHAPLAAVRDVPLPQVPEMALRLLEGASIAHASNGWVIGGSRSRSGKPILANDMHLALRAPSLWYLGAIHGGGIDAAGMMLPGVPVIVAGHTRTVAWGYTNAMVDDVDFFVEQPDSADLTRYRTPAGWAKFEVRAETIQVKGAAPVVHAVRTTRHGPVLSDVEPRAGGRVLAMRWTAQDPSNEMVALEAMNRAGDAAQFMAALRNFTSPHQNVIFADAAGTIGYWMGGTVPVRRGGDGLLPVPGWTDQGEWTRYLEWDEHPHVVNPADGFIVTANNRQLGPQSGYPFEIASSSMQPYRANRIREMVEAGRDLTAADVLGEQMDVHDLFAARNLRYAIAAAEAVNDRRALRELRGWNGEARADSRAAAIFYTWFEALRRRVGEDEYRGKPMYFPRATLENILQAGDSPWVDDVRTPQRETLPTLSADAMREAVRAVKRKRWGSIHRTRIEHPLGAVNALDRALGLNIGPFPNGGSGSTVDVAGYGGTRPPFINGYGPSQRHVVDMADVDGQGGFVIPTGQSGLPFSAHYKDQTQMWRTGRLWLIPLDRAKASARTVARMTLRP
ncbi:MAG TPA: penicillin acylase family protein [Longimicrobiaceae bacterium]|jgi:penicillin amidase|nr:penicillin acylase family protein [Longimicrobiaceae bacterium]